MPSAVADPHLISVPASSRSIRLVEAIRTLARRGYLLLWLLLAGLRSRIATRDLGIFLVVSLLLCRVAFGVATQQPRSG
jgi:hypothetical protein